MFKKFALRTIFKKIFLIFDKKIGLKTNFEKFYLQKIFDNSFYKQFLRNFLSI